jgi:hypothetical protein
VVPLGVALSADGLLLYCGNENGWIDLLHLPTGKIVRRTFDTPVNEVALAPDQNVVHASLRTAGRIAMVDAQTLARVGMLEPRAAFPVTSRSMRLAASRLWPMRPDGLTSCGNCAVVFAS